MTELRAAAAIADGKFSRAEELAGRALRSGTAGAHALLTRILHAGGRLDEAAEHARAGLAENPEDALTHAYLGSILLADDDTEAALTHYRMAVRLRPEEAAFHDELGKALLSAKDLEGAESALRDAVRLAPDKPETHNNLGNALRALGRHEAAAECYRAALARRPDYAEARSNLGVVTQEMGDGAAAAGHYREALADNPDDAFAHTNLGTVLAAEGALGEAEAAHRRAIDIAPDRAAAWNNLGIVLKDQGRLDDAIEAYQAARARDPDDAAFHSNLLFGLCYDAAATEESLFEAHRDYGAERESGSPARIPRKSGDRLRVGYVSPDFYSHSVAAFIEPVIAGHARERYFVACYSDLAAGDAVTERLKSGADLWCDTLALSDTALFDRIREDEIDILVDLTGHTAGNRLPVFAMRAAPVQISWIGYPATTGLSRMDYRITDRWTDPPGEADRWHCERLLRLGPGFLAYKAPEEAPEPRAAASAGPLTYGSFNNLSKINDVVVETWAEILRGAPEAELLLKSRQLADPGIRERLGGAFRRQGIDDSRLRLLGRIEDRGQHLALYNEVDVALDTFPYNGTTTTCEALWMGVPVVALSGERHAGRVGEGLLRRAGFEDWVAGSRAAYIEAALGLATDRPTPGTVRVRFSASSVMDADTVVNALEAAYEKVWRDVS